MDSQVTRAIEKSGCSIDSQVTGAIKKGCGMVSGIENFAIHCTSHWWREYLKGRLNTDCTAKGSMGYLTQYSTS